MECIEQQGVDHFSWMPAFRDPATPDWLLAQRRSAQPGSAAPERAP